MLPNGAKAPVAKHQIAIAPRIRISSGLGAPFRVAWGPSALVGGKRRRSNGSKPTSTQPQASSRTFLISVATLGDQPARRIHPGAKPPIRPATAPDAIPVPNVMLNAAVRLPSVVNRASAGGKQTV